ncbi:MAG TPA: PEP-CTERM sorting domain-containing protein [Chthoniobacterales bacterium]
MNALSKIALTIILAAGMTAAAHAQVSYTGGVYSENFDIMGPAGILTPAGWFAGTGTGAAVTTTAVVASTGSGTSAGNFNYGVAGVNPDTDRALGSLAGSSLQRDTELHITNNTGLDISQFNIFYDGEQWRVGGASSVPNTITLQISLTGLSGSWIGLGSGFNFTSPIASATSGAPLDGNAAANRVSGIGGIYTSATPITNGSTFYLRWADPDDTSNDNGIAIDNLTFQVVPEPSVYMLLGVGILFCGQRFLRRKSA